MKKSGSNVGLVGLRTKANTNTADGITPKLFHALELELNQGLQTIIRDQWTFDDGFIHKTSFVVDDKCQKPFSNTAKTSIILPPLREPAMEILSANGIAE